MKQNQSTCQHDLMSLHSTVSIFSGDLCQHDSMCPHSTMSTFPGDLLALLHGPPLNNICLLRRSLLALPHGPPLNDVHFLRRPLPKFCPSMLSLASHWGVQDYRVLASHSPGQCHTNKQPIFLHCKSSVTVFTGFLDIRWTNSCMIWLQSIMLNI